MAIWATAKPLLFTFGPLLLPRLLGWSQKAAPALAPPPKAQRIRLSGPSRRSLNILFVSCIVCLCLTLPYFADENIYTLTSSRLQTTSDVLFNRLARLRPDRTLTETDEILKSHLVSVESRLLYLKHGPEPLIDCTFCSSDTAMSYIYYAMPTLLTPHLLHALTLGMATSEPCSGRPASKWRFAALVLTIALPFLDVIALGSYDHKNNTTAASAEQITFFHWRLRTFRYLSMAVVDLLLALLIYLSATNRAFVSPLSIPERTEEVAKRGEMANHKLHALGVLKNAVSRDERLRAATTAYWDHEGKLMGEVFEEREVVDRVRDVLGRVDVDAITADAAKYADGVFGGVKVMRDGHEVG